MSAYMVAEWTRSEGYCDTAILGLDGHRVDVLCELLKGDAVAHAGEGRAGIRQP
ncbi:hypothetical protein [Micromonospora chersina]|uniref:hypothetical protein n=1 Tax=Micromonospora chersina TaxID=47854 RepID=UPI003D8FD739